MNLNNHMESLCIFGIINYPNGDIYIGEKQSGFKEGYGTLIYHNKDIYEGEFKNDLKEGYGTLYYSTGNKYEGDFKNDSIEGFADAISTTSMVDRKELSNRGILAKQFISEEKNCYKQAGRVISLLESVIAD